MLCFRFQRSSFSAVLPEDSTAFSFKFLIYVSHSRPSRIPVHFPRVIPLSCLLDKPMVIAFWLQHLRMLLCLLYSTDTANSEPLQWRLKWLAQLVLKGVRLDVTSSAVCFSGWCYTKCLLSQLTMASCPVLAYRVYSIVCKPHETV